MAIFHWSLQVIRRGEGRSSVACAAYRAGACLRDDASGIWTDYSYRRGIRHEIILPHGVTPPPTVRSARPHDLRAILWNRAEAAEHRRNSVVAREVNLALPRELPDDVNWSLARGFVAWIVDRYGVAADVAMHIPDADGDQRNLHCHFLFTTRKVGADLAFGEKTRVLDYIPTGKKEITDMRAEWARAVNHALGAAGHTERIDHRSLADQGIEREPTRHLGPITTNRIRAAERELTAAQAVLDGLRRDLAAAWPRVPNDVLTMDFSGAARGWEALATNHRRHAPAVVIIDERTLGPLGPYRAEAPVPILAGVSAPAEPTAEVAVVPPATRARKRRTTQAVPVPAPVSAEIPTPTPIPPGPRHGLPTSALEAAVGDAALAEVERLNRVHAAAAAAEKRASEEEVDAEAKKASRRSPPPIVLQSAATRSPAISGKAKSKPGPEKEEKKKVNPDQRGLPPLRIPGNEPDEEEDGKPKRRPKAKPLVSAGRTRSMSRAIGMATAKGQSRGGRGGRGR